MLIGSQYADNKMYRGIKHYHKMPLTSEDIHEYSDTVFMKNAYIMNNLLGYGTLNKPDIFVSSNGIVLSEPAVVMIDGDISLIQTDSSNPIISMDNIRLAGHSKGVLAIVGWYQHLNANHTMKAYGGVNNSNIDNDLLIEDLKLQVSSRYQFRWFPILISEDSSKEENITIIIEDRDENGNRLDVSTTINSKSKNNSVFILEKPDSMKYAVSDLYLVPILSYHYDFSDDTLSEVKNLEELRAASSLIVSEEEPSGEYPNGTEWFNPITREFKKYIVEAGGFVSSASQMAFLQFQSIHVMDRDITTPQDIVVPIDISELDENSILQVVYEGIILTREENYTINYEDRTITLKGFTTIEGDHVYFTLTKLVEASDITNISAMFLQHMNTTASDKVEGHVKLSDIVSDKDASNGIAATPKMVKDSKLIVDDTTKVSYKLGIDNGLLYFEEV